MAVNLINGNDTQIVKTNDDIQVEFSQSRKQQLESLENKIAFQSFSQSVTVSGNGVKTATIDVSKTDYTPVGIVGISSSDNYICLTGYSLNNNSANIQYVNYGSREITLTCTITVLYMS